MQITLDLPDWLVEGVDFQAGYDIDPEAVLTFYEDIIEEFLERVPAEPDLEFLEFLDAGWETFIETEGDE